MTVYELRMFELFKSITGSEDYPIFKLFDLKTIENLSQFQTRNKRLLTIKLQDVRNVFPLHRRLVRLYNILSHWGMSFSFEELSAMSRDGINKINLSFAGTYICQNEEIKDLVVEIM